MASESTLTSISNIEYWMRQMQSINENFNMLYARYLKDIKRGDKSQLEYINTISVLINKLAEDTNSNLMNIIKNYNKIGKVKSFAEEQNIKTKIYARNTEDIEIIKKPKQTKQTKKQVQNDLPTNFIDVQKHIEEMRKLSPDKSIPNQYQKIYGMINEHIEDVYAINNIIKSYQKKINDNKINIDNLTKIVEGVIKSGGGLGKRNKNTMDPYMTFPIEKLAPETIDEYLDEVTKNNLIGWIIKTEYIFEVKLPEIIKDMKILSQLRNDLKSTLNANYTIEQETVGGLITEVTQLISDKKYKKST